MSNDDQEQFEVKITPGIITNKASQKSSQKQNKLSPMFLSQILQILKRKLSCSRSWANCSLRWSFFHQSYSQTCFLTAQAVSLLLQLACQTKIESAKMEGYLLIPMFSLGLLISKRLFQDEAMYMDQTCKTPTYTFQRPTILRLNIKDLTASKMNVLRHLTVQH